MKTRFFKILGIIFCCLFLFLAGCANQSQNQKTVGGGAAAQEGANSTSVANEAVIKNCIADFLTKVYSKYYIINSIKSGFRQNKVQGSTIEAVVFTTMNFNVPPRDPETVPFIKDAKEKAQNETNPERKKIRQKEYQTYVSEYGKPQDINFVFKFTANLVNGKIKEESIQLFAEQDAENGVTYTPADEILPKK